VTAPSEEANKLYVDSRRRALDQPTTTSELVITDVGRRRHQRHGGNSLLRAPRKLKDLRPVRLLSFERTSIRLPSRQASRLHAVPASQRAVENSSYGSWHHASGCSMATPPGRFRDFIDSARSRANFYDPFSYKTDAELWTGEIFARISSRCAAIPAELYTYSASTAVRVALLSAGFFVAQGVGTGPKTETTIAFTQAESATQHPLAPKLLDQKWLARWRRSEAKFPATVAQEEKARLTTLIESHRQFLNAV
jgi:queuine tRNA-ribosyltransferase